MQEDWATRFTREAFERIDAFMADHPEYTREGVQQPGQGATGYSWSSPADPAEYRNGIESVNRILGVVM